MLDTSETVMVKAMAKIFLWKLLKQRRYVLGKLMKSLCQDMKNLNLLMKNLLHPPMRSPYLPMKNMIMHSPVMKNLPHPHLQERNPQLCMARLQPLVNPPHPHLLHLHHICPLEMLELEENRI